MIYDVCRDEEYIIFFPVWVPSFWLYAEKIYLKMKTSEVISILIKSVDKETENVIDTQFTEFCFELYVRGFHVYQTLWSPIIGEENL